MPHLDRWQGLLLRGAEAAQGLPKATAALCVNRVPWALNDTTLPTALAAFSPTSTYAATIPKPPQIPQGTRNHSSAFHKWSGLVVVGPREGRTSACPLSLAVWRNSAQMPPPPPLPACDSLLCSIPSQLTYGDCRRTQNYPPTTTAMAVEGGATSPGPREKLDAQIKSADMVRAPLT